MRLIDETEYQDKLAKIPMGERFFVKAVETAQHMPTVDAVEVVRCRNCIHDGMSECPLCYIENHAMRFINHDGNWYCGDGEKKEVTK